MTWAPTFRTCKWFTRGWTLQELLAPASVEFFSREGRLLGSKETLGPLIAQITGIPVSALEGTQLSSFKVEERIQWAATRSTKKPEDKVYCLQGIFDTVLSPQYGEGKEHAFMRLKKAISSKYEHDLHDVQLDPIKTSNLAEPAAYKSTTRQRDLLTSLSFDQMDSRRLTVKGAYSTTCGWLLETTAYSKWITRSAFEEHGGLLWLKGKPGTGKSTVVKFALASASKSDWYKDEIIISFFFNARGAPLERSVTGLYRSLLFQILEKVPDLQHVLDDVLTIHHPKSSTWPLEVLCEAITAAVQNLGRRKLRCFIDALDECDEREIRDMLVLFEDLIHMSAGSLYIFLASRHYPTIIIRRGLELVLEHQPGHSDDLTKYVQSHLRMENGPFCEEIQARILEKADGIFMWVVLVTDILNEEYRCGRNFALKAFAVQSRLDEIPAQLSELFKDILRRDTDHMDESLLCLQWILFAKYPLTLREFYHAMLARLPIQSVSTFAWDTDVATVPAMQRYLYTCSKGLAGLTEERKDLENHANIAEVQFIHESVRDFLLKDGGLHGIWPELQIDPECRSHDVLKQCCHNYVSAYLHIKRYEFGNAAPEEDASRVCGEAASASREKSLANFPFLRYAVQHVLYHADSASKAVDQVAYLRNFPLRNWISVTNLCNRREWRYALEDLHALYPCRIECGELDPSFTSTGATNTRLP